MRSLLIAAFISVSLGLAACSSGGGGSGSGTTTQSITLAVTPGDSQASFSFNLISGATGYTLYLDTSPGVTTATGTPYAVITSPHTQLGMTNTVTYYAILTWTDGGGESSPSNEVSVTPSATPASPYDPPWSVNLPSTVIPHAYNGAQTSEQNGAALKAAMQGLTAGQGLEIGAGTYSVNSLFNLDLQGTAASPIWIYAATGATVIITRPDALQNLINIGTGSQTRYLALRELEFTGGSLGIRFYDCTNIWLDGCHVYNTGDAAISTNTSDTSFMYITRNEINDTGGTGEGMYLGANNGAVIMSNSIIALNWVHDTDGPTVTQGDGIELKQGSWGNLIAENLVHDCNYPCILVYGTAGQPVNIIERNICYNSNDNVMQVQGEAIVRNNLCINGAGSAFASQVHQGNPINLTVIHNTFINGGGCARLSAWNGVAGMVFANNACYSNSSTAINVVGGTTGVTFAGNVFYGGVTGPSSGYTTGNGLSDFVNVTWTATMRDAHLAGGSALNGAASTTWATAEDLEGSARTAPHDTGAFRG